MKTISVKIKQNDLSRYGLSDATTVEFSELVDKITRDFAIQALKNTQAAAKSAGLSSLTNQQIKGV
ncbi:hypothetical protein J0A68_04000 [Algoriphagus sp. H41]|uniref:Uncharacterized protein n=1 Tax=Algoriphagus oliviformis TaxID=2811231 RepID=A0ABS3BZK8_9BACT|nr:hypothetical protein [Algoriphagus oliviformis]MBN7810105.1 hypothetical protein [Algoriphagus oliviformis]